LAINKRYLIKYFASISQCSNELKIFAVTEITDISCEKDKEVQLDTDLAIKITKKLEKLLMKERFKWLQ